MKNIYKETSEQDKRHRRDVPSFVFSFLKKHKFYYVSSTGNFIRSFPLRVSATPVNFFPFARIRDVAANNTYPERKLEHEEESSTVLSSIVDFSTIPRGKEKMREKERQGHDRGCVCRVWISRLIVASVLRWHISDAFYEVPRAMMAIGLSAVRQLIEPQKPYLFLLHSPGHLSILYIYIYIYFSLFFLLFLSNFSYRLFFFPF